MMARRGRGQCPQHALQKGTGVGLVRLGLSIGKRAVIVCLLTAVAAFAIACGGTESGEADAGAGASASGLPRLIDLGADKCVPCKAMAPILEEMQATFEGQLEVVLIDVWQKRDAASRYEVKVIPTQIFLDADGNEVFRHQGFFSREDILAKWRELGYEFDG